MDPEVFVHPSAIVDDGAKIGPGTRIWHWVHVSSGARIGANCTLGQNVFVSGRAILGNNVRVQNNVSIYDEVVLEDDVFCGPSMVFTNVVNPRAHVPRKDEYRPTRVGRGATLGANSTIVCGHDIGAYAFIGAGAVVTTAVPPYALMVGVPARRTGWMCACGVKLDTRQNAETHCSCGRRYRISADRCVALE
jgi:UDP-2-acetamido-3-amino-2,3-dideoxy-glucuronate N-acetyltransferase